MKIYWNGHSKNIIGSRLKELRTAQGISQKTLAARLQTEGFEFTDLTILRIEQGKRFVPDYEIVAIANYFHTSTDYCIFREICASVPKERSAIPLETEQRSVGN